MTGRGPTRTALARWSGGRRFEGETGRDGAFEIESGDDLPGARPTELLLGALAACAGLDVISILEKKRQDVSGYRVSAAGESVTGHPAIFSTITLDHHVQGTELDPAAVRRCVELSATRYCPVTAMLSAGATRVVHRFRVGEAEASEPEVVVVTGPHGAGLTSAA